MAGAVALHFLVGDGFGDALDLGLQVASGRTIRPFVDAAGFGFQLRRFDQCVERTGRFADEFLQCAQTDVERVLFGDFLRHGEVVAGLRLVGVRDGGGADLEIALGRGELLGNGGFLRADEGDVVLRLQHVEIGLGDTQDQLLLRQLELHFGDPGLVFRLFERDPVLLAEQRLNRIDRCAVACVVDVAAGQRGVDMAARDVAAQIDLGQQARTSLLGFFAAGLKGGACGGVLRVVSLRVAVGVG